MRKYAYLVTASMIGLGLSNSAAAGMAAINGGPCTYTSLATAISAASPGDTIWVEGSHIVDELYVDKELLFSGVVSSVGTTCSPSSPPEIISTGSSRVMYIDKSFVTLLNLEVEGGNAVSIVDKTTDGMGGTIYVDNGWLALEASHVSAGDATDGGCVYATGSYLHLNELSSIRSCYAENDGGGAYLDRSLGAVENLSDISGNEAGEGGGGVFIDGTECEAQTIQLFIDSSSSLNTNFAHKGGGAYVQGIGAWLNLAGSMLVNTATGNGGGAFVTGGHFDSVAGSKIWENGAASGAAIAANAGLISIRGGQYAMNVASTYGGAIFLKNESELTIEPTQGCYDHVAPSPTTLCTGFVRNEADEGGAIFAKDSDVHVEHTYFYMNRVTGSTSAIGADDGSELSLYDSFVLSNSNSVTGQAISITDSTGNIEGNTVADNTDRGVVYSSSIGVFDGNIVYDNTSTAPQVVLSSATSLTNCNAVQNVTAAWAISSNPAFDPDYTPTNALMINACSSYGGTGKGINQVTRVSGSYDMGAVEQ